MFKVIRGITSISHGLIIFSSVYPLPCMISHGNSMPTEVTMVVSRKTLVFIKSTNLISGLTNPSCKTHHSFTYMGLGVHVVRLLH